MMRLGIDIGSTTVKLVCLDEQGQVCYSRYERHMSNVFDKVDEMVRAPYDKIHRSMGRGRVISTQIKRLFPHLHRLYRRKKGYGD